MNRVKTAAAVLLTVAVLVTGVYIPKLVAHILDRQNTGKGSLSAMAPVELHITRELSYPEKLVMIGKIESLLPISENKASMTREEVIDALHREIAAYIEADLGVYDECRVETQPYLVQTKGWPELQKVIWQVTVSGNDAEFTFWDMLIDDQSGKILRISYTAEDPKGGIVGVEALQLFTEIYFSGLGIEDPWVYATKEMEAVFVGDNGNAIRFRFPHDQYGETVLDLNVHDHGFYIEFPDA